MYTKENLSSIIKEYRKLNNLTQKLFATKSGISLRALIKIENLETVKMETIEKALKGAERELWIAKI